MKPLARMPTVDLRLGGNALEHGLLRVLGRLELRRALYEPAELELVLLGAQIPPAGLEPGVSLALQLDAQPAFEGEIVELAYEHRADGSRAYTLRARDRLQQLAETSSVRAHLDIDVADLAHELCRGTGLRVDARARGERRRRIEQRHGSDLALLARAAERAGLGFTVHGSTLHLFDAGGDGEPAVELRDREELLELRVHTTGILASPTSVSGWSATFARAIDARAARSAHPGDAAAIERWRRVDGDSTTDLVNELVDDERDALALAQGELDRRKGAALRLQATASGDLRLQPGRSVRLSGAHATFDGLYLVSSVTHTIDPQEGFVTRLDTAPPERRREREPVAAVFGLVTRIDDPMRLGRVCVELPTCGDIESDWLAVLVPGAGPGKGIVSLPDVGDRVLVLLLGGESGEAMVLGGLYGEESPPDAGDANTRNFGVVTPGGQRLRLDDDESSARLEIAAGSVLELGRRAVRLHAASDLTIEAPGRALKIRAASIDFERA